jgi:hypothetical protein
MINQEIIQQVRAHALENYEQGGWDYLVECWSDADIIQWAEDATTLEEAITNISVTLELLDERRSEVRSEIF